MTSPCRQEKSGLRARVELVTLAILGTDCDAATAMSSALVATATHDGDESRTG